MTAGNGQGFIIINLPACIRIYAAALSPLLPSLSLSVSPLRRESSAPIRRWRCARAFPRQSAIKLIPVARGQVIHAYRGIKRLYKRTMDQIAEIPRSLEAASIPRRPPPPLINRRLTVIARLLRNDRRPKRKIAKTSQRAYSATKRVPSRRFVLFAESLARTLMNLGESRRNISGRYFASAESNDR